MFEERQQRKRNRARTREARGREISEDGECSPNCVKRLCKMSFLGTLICKLHYSAKSESGMLSRMVPRINNLIYVYNFHKITILLSSLLCRSAWKEEQTREPSYILYEKSRVQIWNLSESLDSRNNKLLVEATWKQNHCSRWMKTPRNGHSNALRFGCGSVFFTICSSGRIAI